MTNLDKAHPHPEYMQHASLLQLSIPSLVLARQPSEGLDALSDGALRGRRVVEHQLQILHGCHS